jgi:hypothetical protein
MGTQRTLRTRVLGSVCLALAAASVCLLWSSNGSQHSPEAFVTRRYVVAAHQLSKAVAASPICCNSLPTYLLLCDRLQAAGDFVFQQRTLHWGTKHTAALVLSVLVGSAASICPLNAVRYGLMGHARCLSIATGQHTSSIVFKVVPYAWQFDKVGSC